jgi:hypothetical protein
MDADDISLPDRLKWEVEFLETHRDVGLVGGATEWIDATGKGWGLHRCPTDDREIKSAIAAYHPFYHPALLIRREAFGLVGGYRPAFAPAEDYDLTMRISEHFPCANLERVVLKYRIHAHQQSLQRRKQQSYGRLAAQVSANIRRASRPDPLDSAQEITASLLSDLGVTYAKQQHALALDRYQWIRNLCAVGESAFALSAAREMLQSDLEHVERWLVADLRLLAARLAWGQGRYTWSLLAAAHALVTRPVILARPLKPLLRRRRPLDRQPAASS